MIKQKDEIFRFQNKENRLDLSPMKVESIIISNKAMISTQAISLALENNIDLIFLDHYGFPIGRVWFSKMGSTAMIRRQQLEAANNDQGLRLVMDLVKQKLNNQISFLKKLKYARPEKKELFQAPVHTIQGSLDALEQDLPNLEDSRSLIMGLEGAAGRAYFSCLSKVMPEKYRFKGRSKRPALNPFNAVLNYCYGVLYSRVEKACIIAGLDPFVGFMHTDNYNKKSMVFDLIEPFRIFADQVAVYFFTGKKAKDDYFDMQSHSCSLNTKGKPMVIDALNRHLEEKVRYRKRNVKRKHLISHEAHKLANILLEDEGLEHPDWLDIKEF
ncbi:Cas1: CRISPR-associated protein Cas1 [Desulfobacula toluolica Tol2]|uniref:CRISPR-associated endonuclease Cas1 n=3 Tax=Desulfobacteraceae TaxID=213119 RepID=K0NJU0_DESTT|nr:Cas1: CRISPR-associated protein Cas1 [Desulfobacula toluolica Tol2]SDU36728.1 CRISP-associated protein Cas1 [Desulfobacula phenolica]